MHALVFASHRGAYRLRRCRVRLERMERLDLDWVGRPANSDVLVYF
eukprot:SAG11_NODE_1541_length_4721_cov_6.831458_7_plen_46_part_00